MKTEFESEVMTRRRKPVEIVRKNLKTEERTNELPRKELEGGRGRRMYILKVIEANELSDVVSNGHSVFKNPFALQTQ